MIDSSKIVHSSSQLRNSGSTNSCFKCTVSVFFFFFPRSISIKRSEYSLFLSLVRHVLCQSLYPSVLLRDSRPVVSRLICIVDFSHISICESFCLDRSGFRDSEWEQFKASCQHSCHHLHLLCQHILTYTEWLVDVRLDGGRWTT